MRHSIQQFLLDGVEDGLHERLSARRFLLLDFFAFSISTFIVFAANTIHSRGSAGIASREARHAARNISQYDDTTAR